MTTLFVFALWACYALAVFAAIVMARFGWELGKEVGAWVRDALRPLAPPVVPVRRRPYDWLYRDVLRPQRHR